VTSPRSFDAGGRSGVTWSDLSPELRAEFCDQVARGGSGQDPRERWESMSPEHRHEWACVTSGNLARTGLPSVREDERQIAAKADANTAVVLSTLPVPTLPCDVEPRLLPASFWTARPVLEHIRQAAHSRSRSADVVFHSVLTRLAGAVPHSLKLPGIVGTRANLCYFVALVGPPGSGKSTGYGIAKELLPVDQDRVADLLPVGSGEGLVEVLFDSAREPDPVTRRLVFIKRQVIFNAIVYIDEGQALSALGNRSGATTLSTLRSIWSGGTIGQTNASMERKRIVPGGQYTYGLALAMQPTLAGPLLDDDKAGTPQRFGWAWAIDPSIPDDAPRWPGELGVVLPSPDLELIEVHTTAGYRIDEMNVAPEVAEEIQRRDREASRGERNVDQQDAHADLLRLKVAALLALLDGRVDVTVDDWKLAGVVATTSAAVRRHVQALVNAEAKHREKATSTRLAGRAVTADSAVTLNRTNEAARQIVRIVDNAGGEMKVSEARRRCSRNRSDVFEEAIVYATEHGWITEDTEPSRTGSNMRILRVVR
jgi:hypothetical protein